MGEPEHSDSDRTTAADRLPISASEPADGVKVGGQSNYFPWMEPEPEPEMDDEPGPEPFPWGALIWFVMLAMLSVAIGAAVTGR
jgi:hypothetical protein